VTTELGKSALLGAVVLATALAVAACDGHGDGADRGAGGGEHPAREESASTPGDRKILGVAASYPPDAIRAETEKVHGSQAARRALAWRIVAKALRPVPLADKAVPLEPATVPLWETWYAKDEFERMFVRLFGGLTPAAQAAHAPFGDAAIDAAFAWNATLTGVDGRPLLSWTPERFAEREGQIATQPDANGLGGTTRVVYSPATLAHLYRNYGSVLDCLPKLGDLAPDAAPPSATNFAPCYAAEFPPEAVTVKADWRRADPVPGNPWQTLPAFDTSPAGLARTLAGTPDGGADWGDGSGAWDPGPKEIHTVRVSGNVYRLTGLHVVTKELRDWVWITLWWSPDPDEDFGADRPAAITALGPEWAHYKMCVVTAYDEADPDPEGGMGKAAPKLGAALAAVHAAQGTSSWCSNPYLERGAHNARTNCIGCHQHAGLPDLTSVSLLGNEARFPDNTRKKVRANFPSDYLWSFGNPPDDLAGVIARRSETSP
jgi:hypothetical protein